LVCADTPNSRCLLDDGVSAVLCEPTDPDAFGQALLRLTRSPFERLRLARMAHERSKSFRWRDVLSSAVEVYDEALGGGSSLVGAARAGDAASPWGCDGPQAALSGRAVRAR
jgi:glycosyltransferase involved in cell wall biosynthesis